MTHKGRSLHDSGTGNSHHGPEAEISEGLTCSYIYLFCASGRRIRLSGSRRLSDGWLESGIHNIRSLFIFSLPNFSTYLVVDLENVSLELS
jgi:hypothetical protein